MSMNFSLTDDKGYFERRDEIDAAIILAVAGGGKTAAELGAALRAMGIGDAKSDDRLALAYSSTGAILRAATNSLQRRLLIHSSWDLPHVPGPTQYFHGPRPSAEGEALAECVREKLAREGVSA